MGGKDSHGSSTTTTTIPPWLSGVLQPLLKGSAAKLGALQNQGFDVLQGNKPTTGISLEELMSGGPPAGHGNPNPEVLP